jgi:Zn-dependent peptidase ImmA (M78 family)
MPSVTVDVEPAILDWAIRYATDDVADNLLKWKNGGKAPTFNQIESVSRATHIPLGYFFLKNPPAEDFPLLQYRTVDSINAKSISRDMIDTLNHMESIQEWMREYMIESGYDRLSFVGSMRDNRDKQAIIRKVREVMNIAPDWHTQVPVKADAFKFFRGKFEDAGVLVMMSGIVGGNTHRSLSIEEFRAFTLVDEYAPLIFINANDSLSAKIFSLIHEAAHLFLGQDNLFNDRYGNADGVSAIETLCNAVAAEILVPREQFKREWIKQAGNEPDKKIQILANTFNCGTVVIARKALDNQYISHDQYRTIVDVAIERFNYLRNRSSGGDYYATTATRIDNRFIIALDQSVREGKTQYTDAYRLTNTNRKTFSKLLEEVRGVS